MIEDIDSTFSSIQLESQEINVATIIMMPSPRKELSTSNNVVYEIDAFDDSKLYYELGIAHTIVQGAHSSSPS